MEEAINFKPHPVLVSVACIVSMLILGIPAHAQIEISYSTNGNQTFTSGNAPADSLVIDPYSGTLNLTSGVPTTGTLNLEYQSESNADADGSTSSPFTENLTITGWTPSSQGLAQTVTLQSVFDDHIENVSAGSAVTFTDLGVGTLVVTPIQTFSDVYAPVTFNDQLTNNAATFLYTASPEPSTLELVLCGLGLLAFWHVQKCRA